MTIHSKWTTGGLAFYNTGTTSTEFIIPTPSHPFNFGEQGIGFDIYTYGDTTGSYMLWDQGGDRLNFYYSDLNVYGSSGVEVVAFDSSNSLVDFSGWNITFNDAFRTDTTGTGTTGMVTLTTLSPRWQFLAPTSAAGDVMVKLPASSESQGIMFTVYNGCSTGSGWAGGSNLILTTTGMGATTGTVLDTIVQNQLVECYCDGLSWRLHPTTTV